MNMTQIIKILFIAGILLINLPLKANSKSFQNEKSITFSTMDGVTTDAFEGVIQVPENRNKADSRLIPIKYVRFPSTSNTPGHPIIYLSGGPGGSGIKTAKYPNFRFPLFMALREFGDVIALDQRGTGASKTVAKCNSSQTIPLNEPLSDNEVAKRHRLAAKECITFWQKEGADPLGYTSIQNALDLESLRQHFDAEKITLWGISYGSHLALTALKLMPEKIHKVVIASAEGLNQTVKLPVRTEAYFQRLQAAINQQSDAAKMYPNIIGLITNVLENLDKLPIKTQIPLKDGTHLDFLFQKRHMQLMTSGMISDPQRGVAPLLAMYNGLANGQESVLQLALKSGYFNQEHISFNLMSLAMDVASGITNERLTVVEEQAKTSLLGQYLNFPMPHLNQQIPDLDLGDKFRQKPISSVPTLLFTGTLDGRTYVKSQAEAVSGLSNLHQVTIHNAGHNLFMVSPEVTHIIKQFLNNEKTTITEITVPLPNFVM
ncbi:alpha/beta fold hydrolase [Paraglaciecola sp.]|uniref:alpha/beta fold hydrolase n=1 Tax=Paraglaciecola sp. TaxID=1920173 RepID=UPI003EF39241